MKYGLIADVHEDLEFLEAALARFRREQVDRILFLGDLFETGSNVEAAARIMGEANVEGVWGNHDYGLCGEPSPRARERFSAECLAFFATLRPRMEFEDVLICHIEPFLNPEDLADLWSSQGDQPPERSFAAAPHRLMLHGHHHRWSAHTPAGPVNWNRFDPLRLDPDERYLIGLGAVCDGRCGLLDTGEGVLTPIDLRDGD